MIATPVPFYCTIFQSTAFKVIIFVDKYNNDYQLFSFQQGQKKDKF